VLLEAFDPSETEPIKALYPDQGAHLRARVCVARVSGEADARRVTRIVSNESFKTVNAAAAAVSRADHEPGCRESRGRAQA
jgi:hypothetical protein